MGLSRRQAGFIWALWWRPVLTILFPLILSGLIFWKGKELDKIDPSTRTKLKPPPPEEWKQGRGAFIVILMACYWVSECLPLPVTALCPVFLLPLMEIVDTDVAVSPYLNAPVMLLTAGCIMAQAFEYSNLHTRIAFKVACIVGARIPLLLGGVMFTSMFLSMWMNNTSTTSMMIPILAVIMEEFEAGSKVPATDDAVAKPEIRNSQQKTKIVSPSETPSTGHNAAEPSSETPKPNENVKKMSGTKPLSPSTASETDKNMAYARNVRIMFLLGAAWASNIGGTGILTGSATNVIAQAAFTKPRNDVLKDKTHYKNGDKCVAVLEITFLGWSEFNVVPMLISTFVTWIILLLWFMGMPRFLRLRKSLTPAEQIKAAERKEMTRNIDKAILAKYHQLGTITLHEILVLFLFSILVVLWITEKIENFGWGTLDVFADYDNKGKMTQRYSHPAMPVVLMSMLLFVIPKDVKYYKNIANGGLAYGLKDPLLPWSEVETKLPWGPLILIGGGGAISIAITASGLGQAIGLFLKQAEFLNKLPPYAYLAVILIVVALLTTIASNTATAAILSPVLITLAMEKKINPLYLVITAATSSSYAFILPISTPPNAIVFDKSDMKQKEMALPGIIVTIVTNVILYATVHSYCELIFKFRDYNDYCGQIGNSTTPRTAG